MSRIKLITKLKHIIGWSLLTLTDFNYLGYGFSNLEEARFDKVEIATCNEYI